MTAVKSGATCTATAAAAAALSLGLVLVLTLWHPLQTQHTPSSGQDMAFRHWGNQTDVTKQNFISHKINGSKGESVYCVKPSWQ